MPLIKSAIKKLRRDNKKRVENKAVLVSVKKVMKEVRVDVSAEKVAKAYSLIDKALKKGLLKKGTAARKKSQMAKFLATAAATPATKPAKTKTAKATKASKSTKADKTTSKAS